MESVVSILFWGLTLAVMLLPLRLALLLFLVLVHFDPSAQGFASASSVGIGNAVKGILLPVLLLVRSGAASVRWNVWPLALKLWLVLCAYASLWCFVGSSRVAAVKMTAYLLGYLLLFLVYANAWRTRLIDVDSVGVALVSALTLAAVQTYALGGLYGGATEKRFTSFSSAQTYAAFLFYLTALFVLTRPIRRPSTLIITAMSLVGIILTGSRYVLAGFLSFVVLVALTRVALAPTPLARVRRLVASSVLLIATLGGLVAASYALSVERITSFFADNQRTSSGGSATGTLLWRLMVYQTALGELGRRDAVTLVVGSGTSSARGIVSQINASIENADVDANRILHNEFLRAFYEWGIIGLGLLVAVLVSCAIFFFSRFRRYHSAFTLAALCALPGVVFGLLIENVLSGATMPNGAGVVLLLSAAWAIELVRVPAAQGRVKVSGDTFTPVTQPA